MEGLDGCLVKFAKCCNPLPGDEIIGFVTRGYGVSIHKRDCINVEKALEDTSQRERWVSAEWAQNATKESFKSTIDILASDRNSLLADVSITLSNMHVPIHALMAKELKDNQTSIQITLGISDLDQLRTIVANLCKINGVVSVQRSYQ